MLTAYKKFWKQYVDFSSTSSRSDFWWVWLINTLIQFVIVVLSIIALFNGLSFGSSSEPVVQNHGAIILGIGLLAVYGLNNLAIIIPSVALSIRRIRDTGLSPWWYLLKLVSMAGTSVMYYGVMMHPTAATSSGPGSLISGIASIALFIMYLLPTDQFSKD